MFSVGSAIRLSLDGLDSSRSIGSSVSCSFRFCVILAGDGVSVVGSGAGPSVTSTSATGSSTEFGRCIS